MRLLASFLISILLCAAISSAEPNQSVEGRWTLVGGNYGDIANGAILTVTRGYDGYHVSCSVPAYQCGGILTAPFQAIFQGTSAQISASTTPTYEQLRPMTQSNHVSDEAVRQATGQVVLNETFTLSPDGESLTSNENAYEYFVNTATGSLDHVTNVDGYFHTFFRRIDDPTPPPSANPPSAPLARRPVGRLSAPMMVSSLSIAATAVRSRGDLKDWLGCSDFFKAMGEQLAARGLPWKTARWAQLDANGIATSIRNDHDREWIQVSPADVQGYANAGLFVIAVSPNPPGHGHIAVAAPISDAVPASDPAAETSGSGPWARDGDIHRNVAGVKGGIVDSRDKAYQQSKLFSSAPTWYLWTPSER